MLLLIALLLCILYFITKMYSNAFYDTSLWYAKIKIPEDLATATEGKQLMKVKQAALVEGWPSNVMLLPQFVSLSNVVIGFVYIWWAGLIILFLNGLIATIVERYYRFQLTRVLIFFSGRLINRAADYAKKNDRERSEACHDLDRELRSTTSQYFNSGIKVPTTEQIKKNPFGDELYLYDLYNK